MTIKLYVTSGLAYFVGAQLSTFDSQSLQSSEHTEKDHKCGLQQLVPFTPFLLKG